MKNKWLLLAIAVPIVGLLVLVLRNHHVTSQDPLNADGIRDDVAQAIAQRFPESEKKRAAAIQMARAFQMAIEHPNNALEFNHILTKAEECMDAIEGLGPADGPTGTGGIIRDFVVNSLTRTRAYIHANAGLSGHVFSGFRADVSSCEFDPSKMRN